MLRRPRVHNAAHLDFIRSLPCVICLDNTSTEAAHVKFADERAAKRMIGISEKADDRWTLPLCGKHHRLQHARGEKPFWQDAATDPIFVCLALWGVTGNYENGVRIVEAARS